MYTGGELPGNLWTPAALHPHISAVPDPSSTYNSPLSTAAFHRASFSSVPTSDNEQMTSVLEELNNVQKTKARRRQQSRSHSHPEPSLTSHLPVAEARPFPGGGGGAGGALGSPLFSGPPNHASPVVFKERKPSFSNWGDNLSRSVPPPTLPKPTRRRSPSPSLRQVPLPPFYQGGSDTELRLETESREYGRDPTRKPQFDQQSGGGPRLLGSLDGLCPLDDGELDTQYTPQRQDMAMSRSQYDILGTSYTAHTTSSPLSRPSWQQGIRGRVQPTSPNTGTPPTPGAAPWRPSRRNSDEMGLGGDPKAGEYKPWLPPPKRNTRQSDGGAGSQLWSSAPSPGVQPPWAAPSSHNNAPPPWSTQPSPTSQPGRRPWSTTPSSEPRMPHAPEVPPQTPMSVSWRDEEKASSRARRPSPSTLPRPGKSARPGQEFEDEAEDIAPHDTRTVWKDREAAELRTQATAPSIKDMHQNWRAARGIQDPTPSPTLPQPATTSNRWQSPASRTQDPESGYNDRLGRSGSHTGIDRPGSQAGFARSSSQAGVDRYGGQIGLDRPGSQAGFGRPGSEAGFDRPGSQTGFDRPGSQPGFDRPGSQTGFDRPGNQAGFDKTATLTGFSRPGCQDRSVGQPGWQPLQPVGSDQRLENGDVEMPEQRPRKPWEPPLQGQAQPPSQQTDEEKPSERLTWAERKARREQDETQKSRFVAGSILPGTAPTGPSQTSGHTARQISSSGNTIRSTSGGGDRRSESDAAPGRRSQSADTKENSEAAAAAPDRPLTWKERQALKAAQNTTSQNTAAGKTESKPPVQPSASRPRQDSEHVVPAVKAPQPRWKVEQQAKKSSQEKPLSRQRGEEVVESVATSRGGNQQLRSAAPTAPTVPVPAPIPDTRDPIEDFIYTLDKMDRGDTSAPRRGPGPPPLAKTPAEERRDREKDSIIEEFVQMMSAIEQDPNPTPPQPRPADPQPLRDQRSQNRAQPQQPPAPQPPPPPQQPQYQQYNQQQQQQQKQQKQHQKDDCRRPGGEGTVSSNSSQYSPEMGGRKGVRWADESNKKPTESSERPSVYKTADLETKPVAEIKSRFTQPDVSSASGEAKQVVTETTVDRVDRKADKPQAETTTTTTRRIEPIPGGQRVFTEIKMESRGMDLPKAQNPTITLLQQDRASPDREFAETGLISRGPSYLEDSNWKSKSYYSERNESKSVERRQETTRSYSMSNMPQVRGDVKIQNILDELQKCNNIDQLLADYRSTRAEESRYSNKPRDIAEYEPGRSSLADCDDRTRRYQDLFHTPPPRPNFSYTDSNQHVRRSTSHSPSPRPGRAEYASLQRGGEVPVNGFRRPAPVRALSGERPQHTPSPDRKRQPRVSESSRRAYLENLYAEQRRRRLIMEQEDAAQRRHHDNLLPHEKQLLPRGRTSARRFSRFKARALWDFAPQHPRELGFRRGDVVTVTKQIDSHWFEGERGGQLGIFPTTYVKELAHTEQIADEGSAIAKYTFEAQASFELPLRKGDEVALLRKVDDNWYEGRCGGRLGIFPSAYVAVLLPPGSSRNSTVSRSPSPGGPPPLYSPTFSLVSHSPSPEVSSSRLDAERAARRSDAEVIEERRRWYLEQSTADVGGISLEDLETEAYEVTHDYSPRGDDELGLRRGEVVHVLDVCSDGWFVGSAASSQRLGLFPGNHVRKL